MANGLDFNQEIIFSSSDSSISKKIAKAEKEGKIRKAFPIEYIEDKLEKIIIRE